MDRILVVIAERGGLAGARLGHGLEHAMHAVIVQDRCAQDRPFGVGVLPVERIRRLSGPYHSLRAEALRRKLVVPNRNTQARGRVT